MGEDIDALYVDLCRVFSDRRPHALVIKRKMAPGIEGAEGNPNAHEVLKAETAIKYLEKRGGYEKPRSRCSRAAEADKSPAHLQGLERRRQEPRRLRQDHQRDPRRHEPRQTPRQACASSITISKAPRPASHPQEAPRGVRPRRHHGARQLSPPPPASATPRANRASTRRSAPSSRCASARSPWRA